MKALIRYIQANDKGVLVERCKYPETLYPCFRKTESEDLLQSFRDIITQAEEIGLKSNDTVIVSYENGEFSLDLDFNLDAIPDEWTPENKDVVEYRANLVPTFKKAKKTPIGIFKYMRNGFRIDASLRRIRTKHFQKLMDDYRRKLAEDREQELISMSKE